VSQTSSKNVLRVFIYHWRNNNYYRYSRSYTKWSNKNSPCWNGFRSSFRPRRICVRLQFWTFCHPVLGSCCTTSDQSSYHSVSAAQLVATSADQSRLIHRGMTASHSTNTQLLYTCH